MKRVMIIGSCGAGKSTFAKKLSSITGLDLIHLDQQYWKANWKESDKSEWHNLMQDLVLKPQWIIDGNYGGTIDIRLEKADTVVYLDFPTIRCLWRITKRIFKYRGRVRPDMPEGCMERFDLNFYHYVATFNLLRRKGILDKLERVRDKKRIIIFKSDSDSVKFLGEINGA